VLDVRHVALPILKISLWVRKITISALKSTKHGKIKELMLFLVCFMPGIGTRLVIALDITWLIIDR
jgi:hypothetical protein